MSVVRMRFPQQALEELRRIDPQTRSSAVWSRPVLCRPFRWVQVNGGWSIWTL